MQPDAIFRRYQELQQCVGDEPRRQGPQPGSIARGHLQQRERQLERRGGLGRLRSGRNIDRLGHLWAPREG